MKPKAISRYLGLNYVVNIAISQGINWQYYICWVIGISPSLLLFRAGYEIVCIKIWAFLEKSEEFKKRFTQKIIFIAFCNTFCIYAVGYMSKVQFYVCLTSIAGERLCLDIYVYIVCGWNEHYYCYCEVVVVVSKSETKVVFELFIVWSHQILDLCFV